jgi:hypothetical protein
MSRLRLYETHGVIFSGETGNEAYGRCPFTDKEDKFYVNKISGMWDSKTLGRGGNPAQFLEMIHAEYRKALTVKRLQKLATDRQLPLSAFKPWNVGWTGRAFALPVIDAGGTYTDIRMYAPNPKKKMPVYSTATAHTGVFGAHRLSQKPNDPVYLCEGEWDAIAWRWVLTSAKAPGIVVSVPGAGVFKTEWVPWFTGREIHVLYDNDDAGETGELVVTKRLKSSVKSLTFTHWPSEMPTGYDVRDYVINSNKIWGMEEAAAKKIVTRISKMFRPTARKTDVGAVMTSGHSAIVDEDQSEEAARKQAKAEENIRESAWTKKAPTFSDVVKVFRKWLKLENTYALEIMLATALSQRMDGPPVWMFLVGPPGSSKTEHLNALSLMPNDRLYMTSSLTTHALISGSSWKDGMDPSLIPRLDGRVMVIKDFTSILALRDNEKEEIFGILRDAYDGRCGKVFGNGIERNYESRFTIIGAVTPRIYDLGSNHASLGERFLKLAVGDNLSHSSEQDIILRAINNTNRTGQMQFELADVASSFLASRMKRYGKDSALPDISEDIKRRIVFLGMFGARMRGTVSRDTFRNDIITSRPSAEVGSRLGVQLAKLAKSLAMVHGRAQVDMSDFSLLRKVMLDTIPQRTEDILRHMMITMRDPNEVLSSKSLSDVSRYPIATVSRILQDMNVLGIVKQVGSGLRNRWKLSEYIQMCITEAGLYQEKEDLERKTQIYIRIKKKSNTVEKRG